MTIRTLVLAAALAGIALPAVAQDLPDLGGRTIKAVTENAYFPLNFEDPATGQGIGLEYDVFNEIGKRLNAKVEWSLMAWDPMIEAVRQGQFDVGMDGISITAEREEVIDFSEPFISVDQYMLVRADEERITGPESFTPESGLLIGAQTGTTSLTAVEEHIAPTTGVQVFNTNDDAKLALETGQVDAIVDDLPTAFYLTGGELTDGVIVGQLPETTGVSDEFGLVLAKDSPLTDEVSAAVDALREDGTLDAIAAEWLADAADAPVLQ